MQYATIPWDRTPVHAKLDTLEMDGLAKVNALSSLASQVNRVRVEKLGNQVFLLVTYKGFKCSNNISNRLLRCDPLLLKKNYEFLGTIKREGFNQSKFT